MKFFCSRGRIALQFFSSIDMKTIILILAAIATMSFAMCGCVAAVDSRGRTIFVADAHRGDGQRFVVLSDDKLSAFVELEAAIRADESINQSESPAAGCTAFSGGRREFQ